MSKIIENYILQEVAGSGSYGKVYKGKNMNNDTVVAVKVIKLEKYREVPKLHEFTMNEIQTLSKIDNPYIIKFYEMLKTQNNMYLIYEYANGGTLEQVINKKKFLSEPEALKILQQLLLGFKTLAKQNILHRDLKPSNILFHDGTIKIADFGFCKSLQHQDMTATMVGSPIYMAPEILKGQPYNAKADIWSLGVVLFECLFGYCPFEEQSIAKLIVKIDNKELHIPKNLNPISKKTEEILRQTLVVDQRKRIDWNSLFDLALDNSQMLLSQENNHKQLISKKHSSSNLGSMFSTSNSSSSNGLLNVLSPHPLSVNKDILNMVQPQSANNIINQNLTSEDKQKFNSNLKLLIKERNKLTMISTCVDQIVELNLSSSRSQCASYLLMKYLLTQSEQLKRNLETLSSHQHFARKLVKIEQFKETSDFKQFMNIINKEFSVISGCYEFIKQETLKNIKSITNYQESIELRNELNVVNQLDKPFFLTQIIQYIEDCYQKVENNEKEESNQKKILYHLNNVLDCISIDEFFTNFIDANQQFNNQKYFEEIKKYSLEHLKELVSHKKCYIQQKLS